MTTSVLLPALIFGTLFAALWIGVFGIKSVKRDKRRGETSALAHHVEQPTPKERASSEGLEHAKSGPADPSSDQSRSDPSRKDYERPRAEQHDRDWRRQDGERPRHELERERADQAQSAGGDSRDGERPSGQRGLGSTDDGGEGRRFADREV